MKRLVFLCLAALMLNACAGTRTAYERVDGLVDTSKLIGEHYFATVREANSLAQQGVLTGENLIKAQRVVTRTRPVVVQLAEATSAYEQVSNATTEAELEAAMYAAAKAVSDLLDALNTADSGALEDVRGWHESLWDQLFPDRFLPV